MIEFVFTASICAVLATILYQDYRDRLVYVLLYLALGILCFWFQCYVSGFALASVNALLNLLLVAIIAAAAYLSARFLLKRPFGETIGMGDLLFFCASACMFGSISFTVLFVFSLIFSLGLHIAFRKKQAHGTVPLAGYMSLFYCFVYASGIFTDTNFLYAF